MPRKSTVERFFRDRSKKGVEEKRKKKELKKLQAEKVRSGKRKMERQEVESPESDIEDVFMRSVATQTESSFVDVGIQTEIEFVDVGVQTDRVYQKLLPKRSIEDITVDAIRKRAKIVKDIIGNFIYGDLSFTAVLYGHVAAFNTAFRSVHCNVPIEEFSFLKRPCPERSSSHLMGRWIIKNKLYDSARFD
uniref:Uncharacterized protein n=1 Tax=Meloidogyne javanica TaxID=6303 RepID=A0A915LMH8_MELJA